MRFSSKFLLAALSIAIVMAFGVSTAGASRSIEVSETRSTSTFRALTFEGGGLRIVCPVTITLTLHGRSFPKVERTLVGFAEIIVGTALCSGGTARALPGRYHVRYISFSGTLPNIRGIRLRLERTAFLLSVGGFGECLYQGDADGITGPGTEVTSLTADETSSIPLFRRLAGIFCPATGRFRGTATVAPTLRLRLL